MSASQALTSGILAFSGAVRPHDAVRIEKSVTSFRDTLDSASRPPANPPQRASADTSSVSDKRDYATQDRSDARDNRKADNRDDNDEGDSAEADGSSQPTQPASVVAELSAVLAALGQAGASQGTEDESKFASSLAALQGAVADGAVGPPAVDGVEQGPALPGLTGDTTEALDAAKLLALLKAPAASDAAASDVAAETVEVAATVLGQEKHLAIAPPTETGAQVSETPSAGPQLAAQAVEGSRDAATDRPRDKTATNEGSHRGETVATPRGSAPTQDTRTTVGGAFAEQSLAGDGRQQDGSGSSSGGSPQTTTNIFASMMSETRTPTIQLADTQEPAAFDPLSQQIAAEVRAELRADGMGDTSSDGVVKVLHLQLKPANLGAVTVRIALKDNSISIHMEAQHRDTLAMIERERDALSSALSSAGYSVDGITATTQTDVSRAGGVQTGFGDQGGSAPQGQASQGQGLGNSSGDQGRQERGSFAGQPYSGSSDGKDIGGNSARRESEGLYV